MRYKTKININGAELLDEQSDTASSITGVKLTTACGNGFQIGGTASSQLSLTVLKPYKDKFDGDKIDFYIFEVEDTDTTISELMEEVGDSTETVAVEDDDQNDAIETAEDEEEGEEATEEEEAEATTEADAVAANLYDIMNGEEETEETEEVEEDTEQGWILYGSFYVYKQTNNSDGSITLSAYDGFSLMNGTYTPGITSGTFQQYYDDLRSQLATLGVVMDEGEWDDTYTITWNQVASYREAVGYLAGLRGGFATFGDDNTLGISQYGYNEGVLLKSAMQTWKETSSGETEIDSIICTTNLAGDTILAGESGGQPLSCYNPFMTQDILDGILAEYNGITYTGAVFSCNWNAGLLSGELVRVMSDEEFKNLIAMQNAMANSSSMTADEILELKKQINSVGKSILVSSQTISFTAGGETVTEITSYLPTESEKANAPLSPSDAKFRIVTADLIKTKELIADKASITDLEATTARVSTLEAETVKTSELDAKVATIAKAEIADATIKDAQIESINGNKILDGSIVAAALSQEVIKSFGGNDIYYQAEAPTGDLKDGDLWFKTVTETSGNNAGILYVYNGGTWVTKPFDAESILAKSITAAEIASGTITTGEINMDNLQTNIARIGNEDGKHVQIDADSVDIMDGQTVLASYGDGQSIYSENGNIMSQTTELGISGYDDNGLKIYYIGQKEQETVNGTTAYRNHRIISMRCYDDNGTLKLSTSQPITTPAEWDTSKTTKLWAVKYNPSATLEAGDSYAAIPSSWTTVTDAGTDGRGVSNVTVTLTSTAIETLSLTKDDCIFICASYMGQSPQDAIVLFNRTDTVNVTDYIGGLDEKEIINYPVLVINETYVESFMHRGCGGFTYASLRRAHVRELRVESAGDMVKSVNGNDVSFTKLKSGAGSFTATKGTVTEVKWSMCGYMATVEATFKTTGSIAAGSDMCTGTFTDIPKPTDGARGAGAYSKSPLIFGIGDTGAYFARNCGTTTISSGVTAKGVLVYMTDGTML